MRLQYKLRSLVLALWVSACGRIDVDLLPEAGNTDSPLDAQARFEVEDAAMGPDDVGVGVTDASATGDSAASVATDSGSQPIAPNVPVADDAAVRAATDASVADAAMPAVDAGPDAAPRDAGMPDTGAADAGADAATPPCGGKVVLGLCWYLGAANTSCNDVCSTHGGFDTNTLSHVGSANQGGSLANCQQVLSALGTAAMAGAGMRSDGNGVGCHLWSDGTPWWLMSPDATPDVAIPPARIACACKR